MLTIEELRARIDGLAEEMARNMPSQEVVTSSVFLSELESHRAALDGVTPNLTAAYYGFLRVQEEYQQMMLCSAGARRRFGVIFAAHLCVLMLLLIGGCLVEVGVYRVPNPTRGWIDCAWWGMVGASLSTLHTLYVSRLYGAMRGALTAWLFAKLPAGAVLGLLVGLGVSLVTPTGSAVGVQTVPYTVAFIAGFSERRFLSYLQGKVGTLIQLPER